MTSPGSSPSIVSMKIDPALTVDAPSLRKSDSVRSPTVMV
jgi:hypothetical protein